MAYFARIENGLVVAVHTVANAALDPNNEQTSGAQFLNNLYGLNADWIQTSFNNSIRYNYANVGYTFNAEANAFIAPSPNCHPELILDTDTYRWKCSNADHTAEI